MRNVRKIAALGCAMIALTAASAEAPKTASTEPAKSATASPVTLFTPQSVDSSGTVTVGGKRIDYKAVAGTLVVHPAGWDDSAWRAKNAKALADKAQASPEASMFYVAYFKNGAPSKDRPITFLYNGGPGSASLWLHLGAFGPKRIVTPDDSHAPAAPYALVNNDSSLLDRSDLVFIDAPGTGFSRVAGKDKEKAFYGVDADVHAFDAFIKQFLTKYNRWNSPKYLFGESYGTPRSAVLINELTADDGIDFNGVVLLSQILDFNLFAGGQDGMPGNSEGYIVQIPTFAATAWYHDLVPGGRPAKLEDFLADAAKFATTDYAAALAQGTELDMATKQAVAQKLAHFTGLPVAYILKSNLRVDGPAFSKELQSAHDLTTGRLDTRFSGPALDPLAKNADYDPQSAALSSAYITAFNSYARNTLHYDADESFKPSIDVFEHWDWSHALGGTPFTMMGTNVLPDLTQAMKLDPKLKIMVAGGYYDLATPYYQGWYEMHHLPIPAKLQKNIEYHYYKSGHMVYAHEASLKALHDDVAAFIDKTDNVTQ